VAEHPIDESGRLFETGLSATEPDIGAGFGLGPGVLAAAATAMDGAVED
jgi:hypothetical protein